MNDLTTLSQSRSAGSPPLETELAKMLGLVAPVTMSADQMTIWLASAVDALNDIRADEVQAVSLEVRRSVTRPSQIVPEIARLVWERRAARRRIEKLDREEPPALPPVRHIMDRDRSSFGPADWRELNEHLEKMGSSVRYRDDGTRIEGARP